MNSQKPSMLNAALIGGVFLGVTSALPGINLFNCLCCLLIIAGGVLAVYIYNKDYPADLPPLNYGEGAVLGALTGVVGGIVWTVIKTALTFFKLQIGLGLAQMETIQEVLRDANVDVPPQVWELIGSAGALGVGMIFLSAFFNLLFGVIFAALGAIIGVALMPKKTPPPAPAQQQYTPPPPPPPSPAQPTEPTGGESPPSQTEPGGQG